MVISSLNNWITLYSYSNFNMIWNITPGFNFSDVKITDNYLLIASNNTLSQYNLSHPNIKIS